MITQKELKEHLEYRDGHLWWIKPPKYHSYLAGKRFGQYTEDGYIRGTFKGKRYFEHRLIWFYFNGVWPKDRIDHINRVRDYNSPDNLREATKQQNAQNTVSKPNSSSKYKGVGWHKLHCKWISRIRVNGKLKHLGYFDDELEAYEVYCKAAKELHTEFNPVN